MNHKPLLFLALALALALDAKAQFQDESHCSHAFEALDRGQKPWLGNNQLLYDFLDRIGYDGQEFDLANTLYRIPVHFWIYEDDNGANGATNEEVQSRMEQLNHYNLLNQTGIVYYLRGVSRVRDDRKINMGYFLENTRAQNRNHVEECVNVHMVNSLDKKGIIWWRVRFVKGTYNGLTKAVTAMRDMSNTTLAHEIGHFLGLKHPHRNYSRGRRKQESVSRERTFRRPFRHGVICEINGDGLADTPAEPNLNNLVIADCSYGGNERDRWGELYQPNTRNIMSYPSPRTCREQFTRGQIGLMLFTLDQMAPQGWDGDLPHTRFDQYEPNYEQSIATPIEYGQEQLHTFHQIYRGPNDFADNDEDWFTFRVPRNQTHTVTITLSPGDNDKPDTQLMLFDAQGTQIRWDDDAAGNGFSRIVMPGLATGVYYFKVQKKNAGTQGRLMDYRVRVDSN